MPAIPRKMVTVPLDWFTKPFHKSLQKHVRPPSGNTRRKLVSISVPLPREGFEEFMASLRDGDIPALTRSAETGEIEPTRESTTNQWYWLPTDRGRGHTAHMQKSISDAPL